MENKIKIFESEEFGKIRTVIINGEPWFVGKDVADIPEYRNGIYISGKADGTVVWSPWQLSQGDLIITLMSTRKKK